MKRNKKANMAKKVAPNTCNANFPAVSEEYQKLVKNADLNNQDFFINNSTPDHARFLTYTLIKRAKNFIRLFAGDLSETYYDNDLILCEIKKKLEEGIKVHIITRDTTKSKAFLKLQEEHSKLLKIYCLNKKVDLENQFLLIDDNSFRIEYKHSKKDTKLKNFNIYAKANFYNKSVGEYIGKVFNQLKGDTLPID